MAQLHKRFSNDQIVFLFQAYEQGLMTREEVQDTLDIGRSRFFVLWKEYQEDPGSFSISYQRATPKRISPESEEAIEYEPIREKGLIDNPEIPISGYNYSAIHVLYIRCLPDLGEELFLGYHRAVLLHQLFQDLYPFSW